MRKTTRYERTSALPAIAAALALSSTPAWTQEAQPVPSDPTPTVSAPPATTLETAPVTLDSSAPADSAEPVAAPAKPRRTATAAKPAAPVAVRTVTRTTHVSVPVAPPAATPAASSPAPAMASAKPAPIVDLSPEAVERTATAPAADVPDRGADDTVMMLGGGALALLALGGAAVAMTRRRRNEEDVVVTETVDETAATPAPTPRHDPIFDEQPAIVAPAAFAWGNAQAADPQVETHEEESWVERAYEGPTPENPSLSLRKRLKRAAFFDKREREVEAGKAKPVEADAGLPEAIDEPVRTRELESA